MQSFCAKVVIFAENSAENQSEKGDGELMSRYKISVSSNFKELWRYNITLVGELCSADGERIEYKSKESFVAPVGSNLQNAPADYVAKRDLSLESSEGDSLNVLVYVVPHTLPKSDDIYTTKPFPLVVKVENEGGVVLNQSFEINQWSGDNITLRAENGKRKAENFF